MAVVGRIALTPQTLSNINRNRAIGGVGGVGFRGFNPAAGGSTAGGQLRLGTQQGAQQRPNLPPQLGGPAHPGQRGQRPSAPQAPGGNIGGLVDEQRGLNQAAQQESRGNFQGARDLNRAVGTDFQNDPLNQGARGISQQLLDNPNAITPQLQQEIINRQSNAFNAANEVERQGLQSRFANAGRGTAQEGAFDRLETERQLGLADIDSRNTLQAAQNRNQELQQAAGLASGLAGQQAGVQAGVAGRELAALPDILAEDLSGLGALAGLGPGGPGGPGTTSQSFGRTTVSGTPGANTFARFGTGFTGEGFDQSQLNTLDQIVGQATRPRLGPSSLNEGLGRDAQGNVVQTGGPFGGVRGVNRPPQGGPGSSFFAGSTGTPVPKGVPGPELQERILTQQRQQRINQTIDNFFSQMKFGDRV